jgi:hypothetical protein
MAPKPIRMAQRGRLSLGRRRSRHHHPSRPPRTNRTPKHPRPHLRHGPYLLARLSDRQLQRARQVLPQRGPPAFCGRAGAAHAGEPSAPAGAPVAPPMAPQNRLEHRPSGRKAPPQRCFGNPKLLVWLAHTTSTAPKGGPPALGSQHSLTRRPGPVEQAIGAGRCLGGATDTAQIRLEHGSSVRKGATGQSFRRH